MTCTKFFREDSIAKELKRKLTLNFYMTITKTTIIDIPTLLVVETLNSRVIIFKWTLHRKSSVKTI